MDFLLVILKTWRTSLRIFVQVNKDEIIYDALFVNVNFKSYYSYLIVLTHLIFVIVLLYHVFLFVIVHPH